MYTKKSIFPLFSLLSCILTFNGCIKEHEALRKVEETEKPALADLKNCFDIGQTEKNYKMIITAAQKIMQFHPDYRELLQVKESLADAYVHCAQYEPAYAVYKHLSKQYPHEMYTFKRLKTMWECAQQTHKYCDTTRTQKVVKQSKRFLKQYSASIFKQETEKILKEATSRLIEKELHVTKHYIKSGKYTSARHRLLTIEKRFLADAPEYAQDISYQKLRCEMACPKKQRKEEVAQQAYQKLVQAPSEEYAEKAKALIKKHGFHLTSSAAAA